MKCLYCKQPITTTDPKGSCYVKVVDAQGRITERQAWHPDCRARPKPKSA